MQDLMSYEKVKRLLKLKKKDETRNREFLTACSNHICEYLGRKLLLDTTTEVKKTDEKYFGLVEYPVREILEIVDTDTGEHLKLQEETKIADIGRPDNHKFIPFVLDSGTDRTIKVTYRYGYSQREMPVLIQAKLLELMWIWLAWYETVGEAKRSHCCVERMEEISFYRRRNKRD